MTDSGSYDADPGNAGSVPADERAPASAELEAVELDAHPVDDDRGPEWGNKWGWIAVITGALALSPVAIVMGHLGLRAAKRGQATNRPVALAGLILGYVGLALIIAVAVLSQTVWKDTYEREVNDLHAQQDVIAVGVAIAEYWDSATVPPEVANADSGYVVDAVAIDANLTTPHSVVFTGAGPATWCILLVYEGGTHDAYSYSAVDGSSPDDSCVIPENEPSPEPSVSPSADPSASPTAEASPSEG